MKISTPHPLLLVLFKASTPERSLPHLGTGLGAACPIPAHAQGLTALADLLLLLSHTLRLLVQPRGVITLPRDTLATIQLKDPSGHVV